MVLSALTLGSELRTSSKSLSVVSLGTPDTNRSCAKCNGRILGDWMEEL